MNALLKAAKLVIGCWEKGDLAAAVRELDCHLQYYERAGEAGDHCPFCQSDLGFGDKDYAGGRIEQLAACSNCGRRFSDLYEHATRRQLDESGNEVVWGSLPEPS